MPTSHTCIIADSRQMHDITDHAIQLVVTSPPYWQLKDYGSPGQIGFDNSYEEYINNLNLVWQECYRILAPGCRLVINIGDQFARSAHYGRYKVIPIRTEIIRFCETIGFDYMGAIIWQKKTTMNTTGGATVMGSYPSPRNGIVEIDYEFILIFRKPGKAPTVTSLQKQESTISKDKWRAYFSGHWTFGGARQTKHIAIFPVELPRRVIEMFTFVDETVLDPFLGSGTTSLAAALTGRNSIGYEVNASFVPVITNKMQSEPETAGRDIQIVRTERVEIDWLKETSRLPYIFQDPVKVDKKRAGELKRYGSKISLSDQEKGAAREIYYTVTGILSPNLVELNHTQIVRLLGVRTDPEDVEAATAFLENKILKRKVFIKTEGKLRDEVGHKLIYLYLKNKTFINAHLLKNGLAVVDCAYPFALSAKFERLQVSRNRASGLHKKHKILTSKAAD